MTLDTLLNWDRDSALAAAPAFRRLHPNWITTISLVLAGAGLWLLATTTGYAGTVAGAGLIFLSRWVDWIDGWVARETGKATNLGGLYDIAVGYLCMVGVMIAIGHAQDDAVLAWTGAGAAIVLRVVLMACGWGLAHRQRLTVIPWNPQKMLYPRMPRGMKAVKNGLDIARTDYWVFVFAVSGGLVLWAWLYTAVVIALTCWVLAAATIWLRRVPAGTPPAALGGAI